MPETARPFAGYDATPAVVEDVDILVLGSGEAGKYIAWTFARKGWTVAVIERRWIGGSCPNIACLPSKNVIQSAKVASLFRHGSEFGLPEVAVPVNMISVRERKRAMVRGLVQMHEENFASSGAQLILGEGRFVAPKTIQVATQDGDMRVLRGSKVIIGTGTSAAIPTTAGLAAARPMTHVEALELDEVPATLIVIGAGFIGIEFAQAMQRLGSKVILLDRNDRLLHREDPDVSHEIKEILIREGVHVVTGATIHEVSGRSGERVRITYRRSSAEEFLEGTHLLVTGGRTPNTRGIGLEEYAGVRLDEQGYIAVDERLETTAKDVFAVGDCNGGPQFTHVAFDDFRIVRDTLNGFDRTTRDRVVPFCLFTDPEYARIGLTEKEAGRAGHDYKLFKIPMTRVLRTRTLSETDGYMKALVSLDNEVILGFACLGHGAGELLATIQVAMKAGWAYSTLNDMMFTHPTMSEGFINLFSSVPQIVKPSV